MQHSTGLTLAGLCVGLGACANLETIDRVTDLPSSGRAIHLDAQQRLVLVSKDGTYCAEPSPDALAAYASSLGLGISVPSQGAGSAAQALQSAAGSIGLRTQSIQLMRDALYRVCEASADGVLQPLGATLLLARSQDLTAVVVATEQLTGAVVANQLALTSNASASASADLVANQQLLDQARQDEAAKKKSLDEATTARDQQKQRVADQQAKVTAATNAHDAATAPGSTASDDERKALETKMNAERATLADEQKKLDAAEADVKNRQDLLTESTRVRQAIEDAKNAALTQATAATGAAAQFTTPAQRNQLSQQATERIADAVQTMVTEVLRKDYTVDACTDLLTYVPPNNLDPKAQKNLEETRGLCIQLINARIEKQTAAVRSQTEDLVLGEPVPRPLQARVEAAAAYIKTLSQPQLDRVALALQLPTGPGSRIYILRAIASAQSEEAFNEIAKALKTSCQDSSGCVF
jgi:hypothetical protein